MFMENLKNEIINIRNFNFQKKLFYFSAIQFANENHYLNILKLNKQQFFQFVLLEK